VEGVLAEAGGVCRVGDPASVVGDVGAAYGEERVPFSQRVSIEDDFFVTFGARRRSTLPAVDRVLAAFFGAGVIPPIAVAERNCVVGLLDVAKHLVVERGAQAGEWRHYAFGIGVLCFEIGSHFGIFFIPEPGVIVDQGGAVEDCFGMLFAGDRGRGSQVLSHLLQCICLEEHFRRGCRGYPHPDSLSKFLISKELRGWLAANSSCLAS